jgi:hypothetical protein
MNQDRYLKFSGPNLRTDACPEAYCSANHNHRGRLLPQRLD